MALLVCKDLILGYEGRTVISNLSFSLEEGDYLCIVGANGSGKSTLMRTLLGLKVQMSGQIIWDEKLKKTDIGYLSQQVMVQKDFPATVKEIVLSGYLNKQGLRPFYTKEEKQLASDNMAKLGISTIGNHCYSDLSGGQKQRVLLARALSATGKILFLDEPVAGLDLKTTEDTYDIVSELNNRGVTIIMISHDIFTSVKYASHILHIDDNTVSFFGTKEEYARSDIGRVYGNIGGNK